LDEWNQRRKAFASVYQKALGGVPGLVLPYAPQWSDPIWHIYLIRHPQRDRLQAELQRAGIGTLVHYPIPPHLSDAYTEAGWKQGDFPITEELAKTVLSIPMGPHMKPEDLEEVIEAIRCACSSS
jgi:dTDP-4-amino-4,6-dideoxygalactose transaminase